MTFLFAVGNVESVWCDCVCCMCCNILFSLLFDSAILTEIFISVFFKKISKVIMAEATSNNQIEISNNNGIMDENWKNLLDSSTNLNVGHYSTPRIMKSLKGIEAEAHRLSSRTNKSISTTQLFRTLFPRIMQSLLMM